MGKLANVLVFILKFIFLTPYDAPKSHGYEQKLITSEQCYS